ncbi:T9SS type A sorting domain-containing protein [Taibaiella lutea]|uniref:T9SS type A sorting domain-containing protein n=1 Tax=Taibaiella lutea TaxID=2608001 RepID=A0A5M6CAF4_9BACT|nr:T9SS type A sorting domain-containing protein [Taibaiella lutea]KAA5532104.1 T9SS type A sorting domain-containing protein [Taibaiella lutea]
MKSLTILSLLFLCLFSIKPVNAQVLNVCEGDSLKLSTAVLALPNATTVEWFKDNVLISTDTAFVITQPGVYTLRCTGTTGCVGDFSQPLTVVVDSLKATNDSTFTTPGSSVNIRVLINDLSACYPIDTPSLTIVQQPSHGTATVLSDGTFKYDPNPGFTGIDTFYYVINDVNGNPSNIAMVIVTIDAPVPLGITLGGFEAVRVEDEAHLFWNTLSTKNASHFEIERSGDIKNFEFKGKVVAPANSNENVAYNYWDKKPLAGKNYYRLKMVNLDGKSEYSEIRMVNFSNDNSITLYPNPAKDYITVDLGAEAATTQLIIITDAVGKEVLTHLITGTAITIDLNNLATGAYFVKLLDKNNNIKDGAYKFSKVK